MVVMGSVSHNNAKKYIMFSLIDVRTDPAKGP
jgi:hypothetical protein